MANSLPSIEKLNGENYGTWCIQIKSLLITMDLWNTIENERPVEEAAKSIWINNDRKALATITLSVKASELIHIKNCTTGKEAWNVLNSLYKADTASRKVKLFKKLVRFKFRSGEKFSVQINEFCSTINELKEIGIALNDDLLTILLLCNLPDEMEGFVIAIESRDNLPTYENLISKILEERIDKVIRMWTMVKLFLLQGTVTKSISRILVMVAIKTLVRMCNAQNPTIMKRKLTSGV